MERRREGGGNAAKTSHPVTRLGETLREQRAELACGKITQAPDLVRLVRNLD